MAFHDFAALKENVLIEDAIAKLGLELKQTNGQFRGPCPICNSAGSRSMVITPAKQAFYCFGERIGGDVIALVAHIHQSSMKDAADFLVGDRGDASPTVPKERKKEAVRSLQPLNYLEPDSQKLNVLGIASDTCNAFGAGYAPKGIMRGKLAFPIHDGDGVLRAYGGIPLDGDHKMTFPKAFDPETIVFNTHQIDQGALVLCRSPLEVMIANQNGIENTISFLTDAISSKQLNLLANHLAKFDDAFIELP